MILEAERKAAGEEPATEPLKAKTKSKKSSLELHEEFINEIKIDEKSTKYLRNIFFIILHYF